MTLLRRVARMRYSPSWWMVGGTMMALIVADVLGLAQFDRQFLWLGLLLAACTILEWLHAARQGGGR